MMSAISGGAGGRGGLIRHGLSHQTKLGLGARRLTDGVRPMARGGGAAPGILMTSAIDWEASARERSHPSLKVTGTIAVICGIRTPRGSFSHKLCGLT